MPTIVIFRTGGIGDVILSTVALTILRKETPGVAVHWFGRGPTLELIRTAFPEVSVHEFPAGASHRENVGIVHRACPSPDLILDLQRSARTMIMGGICAARFRCRYVTWNKYSLARSWMVIRAFLKPRSRRVTHFALPRRHEAMAHCVVRALERVGWIKPAASCRDYTPQIQASSELRMEDAIAINLGVLHRSKALPFAQWQIIVRHIADQRLCEQIIFLGETRDRAEADALTELLGGRIRAVNHCGKTTLPQAATLLASCRCTLSNDSALAHLSESVGTPVITFFGPTHEGFGYRPFLPLSLASSHAVSCRPCTKAGATRCRFGDFECFGALDIQPALEHLHRLLSQRA